MDEVTSEHEVNARQSFGIVYILRRLEWRWLNAHWLFVIIVIFACPALFAHGCPVLGVLLALMQLHFLIGTWPIRWPLDLLILAIAFEAFIDWLGPGAIQQWMELTQHL